MDLDVDVKRKATVRVSRKDLQKLLAENEQMAEQITDLQTRLNELLEENRELKRAQLPSKPKIEPKPEDPNDPDRFPDYNPNEFINPNIYFDGSNGLGSGRRFGSND